MRFLLFFLCLTASLFAEPKDPYSLAVTEGEPAALVEGCVSAITGDFYLNEVDALIQGYIPLRLPRQHLSGDGKGRLAGWSFIDHLHAVYKGGDQEHKITIQEPNGSTFVFKCPAEDVYNHFRKKKHPPKFRPPAGSETLGLTNTSQGEISGRNNLKNAYVRLENEGTYLVVYCSDQTVRRYKVHHEKKHFKDVFTREESSKIKYLLESETLPSGHQVIYNCDKEDRLVSIRTTSPSRNKTYAQASFNYRHKRAEKTPTVDISLSDGRVLSYRYEEKGEEIFLLRTVISPDSPEESIFYHPRERHSGSLVSRITLPQLRFYDIDYYREGHNNVYGVDIKIKDKRDPRFLRVKTLKAPINHDDQPHPTHRFFYFPDQRYTDVRAIDNTLTRYHYSPSMRLETILRFDHGDVLNHRETFEWSGSGDLYARSYFDAQGSLMLSRRFQYDDRGNVTREELRGNLSGQANHQEVYAIRREYSGDQRDLLLKEEEQNGKTTLYTYLANTNLVTGKFLCDGPRIKVRTFYEYDGDHVLIKEIQDDGVTTDKNDLSHVKTRTIKAITPTPGGPFIDMPQVVEERYWDGQREVPLKKTVFCYTAGGKIERQDVYDADGAFRYSLKNTYDGLGRLTSESNAMGQMATYTYDAMGNRQTATAPSGKRRSIMHYDFCNRLKVLEEIGLDQITHTTHYNYDSKHNKIAVKDSFGNATYYDYDFLGRVIRTHLPTVLDENGNAVTPVIHSGYDSAGREVARTDGQGFTTLRQYNAKSQVTSIQYPDGSKEYFLYNLEGTLRAHTDQEGHTTTHTYDTFGRCVSTKDPLGMITTYIYDAFHLTAIQDAEGYTTTYTYDGAGRKIAEERNNERIEYTYDNLGRLRSVKTGDLSQITEYDLLNRVTEERQEDQQGHLFSKVTYAYDEAGNQKAITRFVMGQEVQELFSYDSFDRLILHTDTKGYQTTYCYDESAQDSLGQRILQKTTTDPLGQRTIETYDSLGRSTSIQIENSVGATCSSEKKYYDKNNNLCRQISTLYPQEEEREIQWEYDNRNQLIALFEPGDKETFYSYTPKGYLKQTIKPDQVVLKRGYDPKGNLVSLQSSDQTIAYAFRYNALGQLVSSLDLTTQTATLRMLDSSGKVLTEKLAHGLALTNTYDAQGRRIRLTLPSKDLISYDYDALFLRSVNRYNASGMLLYTHAYEEYDLSYNLLREQLIYDLGHIDYTIFPDGKEAAISSPFFSQNITGYDPVGNITALNTQSDTTQYSYDDLYQLTQETGPFPHTYAYDSHYNRLQKDGETYSLNSLDQLTTRRYDPNGNLALSGHTSYTYDALDRLIGVQAPHQRLKFTYDSFHRRLSKTVYEQDRGIWQPTEQYLYLYDGQNEIGATDSSGNILQLRVLGITPHAEIGAAIAIEIEGKTYAPIHDLFGNVAALVSPDGQICQSYRYDSFGNHTATTNLSNPWKFASKRQDQTGLIFFGRRYFDPAAGRWTTPDPIGFQGGINLYSFVENNPLAHLDLYGLNIYSSVPPVTTPMIATQPVAPPQVSTRQVAPGSSSNSSAKSARSTSPKHSMIKNFSVGAVHGMGNCGLAVLGTAASCGQIISAPLYFLSGQWAVWGQHWDALQSSNVQRHYSWERQMQNLLPNEERLPYYSHIVATTQSISDGVLLGAALGPALLSKGVQALAQRSVFNGIKLSPKNSVLSIDSSRVGEAEKLINTYLGEGTLFIRNRAGDPVFLSKDGLRRVRFDFERPYPHISPHMHIDENIGRGIWKESKQIYPINVPPY